MDEFEIKMILVIAAAFVVGVVLLVLKDKKNGTGTSPTTMISNGRVLEFFGIPAIVIAVVTCASENYTVGLIVGVLGLLFFFGGKEMVRKGKKIIFENQQRERQLEMEAAAKLEEMEREREREKLAEAIARQMKKQ